MKLTILKLLILLLIFISCNDYKNVKIKFQLEKNTFEREKGKYLYLKNVNTKTLIDSLIINKEDNQFTIQYDTNKVSEVYSILMNDTLYMNGVGINFKRLLGYFNPYNNKEINSTFYVEPNMNKIYLFNSIKDKPNGEKIYLPNEFENNKNIKNPISKQNDIILKNIVLSYSDTNTDERLIIIPNNIKIIKKYPYSIVLLNQLFRYKTKFRINDLRTQLSFFDNDIKKTTLFKRTINYTNSNTSTFDKSYPEFIDLENEKGELKNIGNPKSKMNLIVYWSWWCGPCRKEIPYLRELYKKYKDKGLNITSISIDPDKNKWLETLKIENMEWEQLIVSPSSLSELQIHFEINSIPKSYLYDDKNKLIDKFSGFSETDLTKLKSYLIKIED
ncbi:MAG: TlpA disulfide reductase family protein [Sediminibacterium sp.]